MLKTAKRLGVEVDKSMGRGKLIDEIFSEKCEGQLIQPTFITDYPIEMSPLAKKHREHEGLVERFEGFCNQKEICKSPVHASTTWLRPFLIHRYSFVTW